MNFNGRDPSFYVDGGTLPPNAPSYIEREADRKLLAALRHGEFCYVFTSRQMGKSSLMVRTAKRLRQEGTWIVALDLTALGRNLTAEQWYYGLMLRMSWQLHLEEEMEGFWGRQIGVGPVQRFFMIIRQVILPQCPEALVIFVDEVDTIQSLPFSTGEFFAAIRECYNCRATDSEFNRLAFCLLGVATPSDIIRDTRVTPFNIGRRIELDDFTPAEAAPLARGLHSVMRTNTGLSSSEHQAQVLLNRILYWTHGHPFLTQRLFRALVEYETVSGREKDSHRLSFKLVDQLCKELFLSPTARERDDNLLFVRERLLHSSHDRVGLLHLYERIHRGKPVPHDETNSLENLLRLSGLTRVADRYLKVRNRIYFQVFDEDWIHANMPDAELRRQKEAFWRGVMRTTGVAAVVLVAIGTLGVTAFQQWQKAERLTRFAQEMARERQEQLVRLTIAKGQELLDRGNLLGSLPWYTAAFKLDQANSRNRQPQAPRDSPYQTRMKTHRVRLNAILRECPRIVQMWVHPVRMLNGEFHPDGKRVLIRGRTGKARLFDIATGEPVSPPIGHGDDTEEAMLSPDGEWAVTYSEFAHTAYLWNVATGKRVGTFPHAQAVHHADFSPNGKRLVTAVGDNTAVVWDVRSCKPLTVLKGHEKPVL